jgi:hypothetical protein
MNSPQNGDAPGPPPSCVCSATRHDGIVQEIGHEQMPAVTVEARTMTINKFIVIIE